MQARLWPYLGRLTTSSAQAASIDIGGADAILLSAMQLNQKSGKSKPYYDCKLTFIDRF